MGSRAGCGPSAWILWLSSVDGQHDGVGRRSTLEADDVARLSTTGGSLESLNYGPPSVGLKAVRFHSWPRRWPADPAASAIIFGGPVRGFRPSSPGGSCNVAAPTSRSPLRTRRSGMLDCKRLVAQQSFEACRGEALLHRHTRSWTCRSGCRLISKYLRRRRLSSISRRARNLLCAHCVLDEAISRWRSVGRNVKDIPVRMRQTVAWLSPKRIPTGRFMLGRYHRVCVDRLGRVYKALGQTAEAERSFIQLETVRDRASCLKQSPQRVA